jgi:hypothetical protein
VLAALFRWREAEPGSPEAARAAQSALDSGPLAPDDPLLGEIERRISTALAGTEAPETQKRARAVEKLRLLRSETGGRAGKLKRIEELLQKFQGDLSPDELAEVRNLRAELALEGTPSRLDEFVEAFRLPAERIELASSPKARATLRFDFCAGPTGSFEKGEWISDGKGWIAPRAAHSDQEMLAAAAPTLALRDPLRLSTETFEIGLRFEQPEATAPNLLLVSAAGIQVVLSGTRRPRCLVRTGEASAAVESARRGEGQGFEGLDRGATYELRIALNRTGRAQVDLRKIGVGKSTVEGEWKHVANPILPATRGDDRDLALTIRSFETVRLLAATIDAGRR